MNFDVLQLIDSAFPIGSFAHSGGLEAFCVLSDTGFGSARDNSIRSSESFERFEEVVACVLENAGFLQGPFVRDAFQSRGNMADISILDRTLHVFLSNHIVKRASLQQGKSLAALAQSTFCKHPKAEQLDALLKAIKSGDLVGHFAVIFGCICHLFELDVTTSLGLFLFGVLRTVIGSAIRLGLCGPVKAQQLQNDLQCRLPDLIERSLAVTEPHISHPVLETLQNAHDKMFAKLFYS